MKILYVSITSILPLHQPFSPLSTSLPQVIPLDISEDQEKRNIISELEVLYQCHSDYIIAFYGAYFLDNRISVCAEYMDGRHHMGVHHRGSSWGLIMWAHHGYRVYHE